MLKPSLRANFVTNKQLGFQSPRHIFILVVVAIAVGFVLFLTSNPAAASTNATVIANIFAQTLPTSIAEVVVCWAVVGTVFESLVRIKMHGKGDNSNWKKGATLLPPGAVSIVLFGVYHFCSQSTIQSA